MLTSLVLSLALAAPVPPAAPPVAAGPVPRLLEVKPNADGKVLVTVLRTEYQKVTVTVAGPNGGAVNETREVPVSKMAVVELAEVKGLAVTTADGKKVDPADAVKAVAKGAVVVVSADGKPVSPLHLKLFKDDVLVLVSPELAAAGGNTGRLPAGGVQVLPAAPGGVQIQIAPAAVPAVPLRPAQPVIQPAPAPKPEK